MSKQAPARFRAYRVRNDEQGYRGAVETVGLDELSAGDLIIRVAYSGINYKDALAGTGKGKIMRSYPMAGGIDVAGTEISSASDRFSPGDEVLVTGAGLSETRDGGYAEYLRLDSKWAIPLPAGLSALDSMTIGTAGFTAALGAEQCISRHELAETGRRMAAAQARPDPQPRRRPRRPGRHFRWYAGGQFPRPDRRRL